MLRKILAFNLTLPHTLVALLRSPYCGPCGPGVYGEVPLGVPGVHSGPGEVPLGFPGAPGFCGVPSFSWCPW